MLKILKGVPATLPVGVEGEDGPLTLDAPPSVTVKDADGAVTASGTASGTAGAYSLSIPAQSRLGRRTVTVSGLLSGVAVSASYPLEVVGGFLYSIPQLRGFDAALDVDRYSDVDVKRVRAYVDDEFRMITNRAFTRRATVETVPLFSGRFYLENFDPSRVVAATVDGTAVDASTITLETSGEGYYSGGCDGSLTIEYEYGFETVPEDVRRAAMLRGRTVLYDRDSGIPDRATSFNVDGAQFSLATAGRAGYETGVPEVDAILARYRIKPPGVA